MYNIKFYNDEDGDLQFESTNKGRLEDISEQTRAKVIPFKKLMKEGRKIKKNLFLCKSDMIISLTKKEDKEIDALYYNYNENHILIVPKSCITTFDL